MKASRELRNMVGGMLAAGAIGASAGLLTGVFLAPKSGRQLRSEIRKRARRTWNKIGDLM